MPADWVNKLPPGIDARTAMGLGTAGFTAALAIHRMEQMGQVPEMGPIAVTGATGGVGSVAIALLAGLGFQVTAVTSKTTADDYLKGLGATDIFHLKGKELGTKPLEKVLWGGAVDNLGGATLAWLTRTVAPYGSIASIGLAQGPELQHHRDALHPAGREPARHQLRGGAPGRCAPRSGAAWPGT